MLPAAGETTTVIDAANTLVAYIEDAAFDRYENVPSRIRHAARDLRAAIDEAEDMDALQHRLG